MSNAFRWCFIGTGTLANTEAKTITASGRHKIVSVFTRRIEKAREVEEKAERLLKQTALADCMEKMRTRIGEDQ